MQDVSKMWSAKLAKEAFAAGYVTFSTLMIAQHKSIYVELHINRRMGHSYP